MTEQFVSPDLSTSALSALIPQWQLALRAENKNPAPSRSAPTALGVPSPA